MTFTPAELRRAAATAGFQVDSFEKVCRLLELLETLRLHPFLKTRVALKGGTALNLFVHQLPRLSVDVDLNYLGTADRAAMLAERPKLEQALEQVCGRLSLGVRRAPEAHAGGKWRLGYTTWMGRPGTIEVDLNYLLRTPLWPVVSRDSLPVAGRTASRVPLLEEHELAAGKLAALVARSASRDLFDTRELLRRGGLDREKLRLAFVVYGGANRVDWRKVSARSVATTAKDVDAQLAPMLRQDIRPAKKDISRWTGRLIEETRDLLRAVLPLRDHEREFIKRLNEAGEIVPELLASDSGMRAIIRAHPGLNWKAINVRAHRNGNEHEQEPEEP